MHCPFCSHEETKVIDSRLAADGSQVRRRRECLSCGERYTTFEAAVLVMPVIVKSDKSREPFDERKLRDGLHRALQKRPVGEEAFEESVNRIGRKLRVLGEREVESRLVGEMVMDELRQLDEVAYVRFASVYRRFQDADAFRDEVERLKKRVAPASDERQLPLLPNGKRPGRRKP
ncbi:MAG: transcriptional regulator NrdR [Steroidobacteraceae bacterium]